MDAFISVIVPVYNVEKYISDCIDSLINQSYKNLEIIIVDDGSTDSSGQICEKMALLDERINVYHKKNGGLSDARNYGMQKATGEFLAFIDSDDIVDRSFFFDLMTLQVENNADIVSSALIEFSTKEEIPIFENAKGNVVVLNADEILKEYFIPKTARLYHGLCMKIYKKKLFNGLLFEKGKLHEDLYITYKLLDRCQKLVYLDKPLYYYRRNNTSICNTYGVKNFRDECNALFGIRDYFSNKYESDVRTFIVNQLFFAIYNHRYILRETEVYDLLFTVLKWLLKNLKLSNSINILKKICMYNITILFYSYLLIRRKSIINE
ncbi:glycosyltransferase [Pseudobutyrivibrio sp. LB2011]|uniref:glycosyltransferase n=1 Tax=Pseudobutyrivibrio sp. LB2011 TaxID=1408312 RepID=UPI0006787A60|nr:glycosyltransferase [Pseudobutyrivibrio sp. LB2011]